MPFKSINPTNFAASVPLRPNEPLYGVQYRHDGRLYSYRLSKLMVQFGATQAEVEAAAAICDADPTKPIVDGPLKGLVVQTMTPEAQDAVREAYRQKLEAMKMQMQNQPLDPSNLANPYTKEYVAPYHLIVGDRAMRNYEDED